MANQVLGDIIILQYKLSRIDLGDMGLGDISTSVLNTYGRVSRLYLKLVHP